MARCSVKSHVASVMRELPLYPGGDMPYRPPTPRLCSKSSCSEPAAATLTYVYADSQAVVGPLAEQKDPHSYDLCPKHADGLRAPLGWHVVRYRPYPDAV